MLHLFSNRTFARLFAAQVVALLGTGLMTVALALLAYDLAGADAGKVLGTALAIKMVAYVGLSPLAAALFGHLPRRAVLVAADLVRAGAALSLPFLAEVWQVYLAIFVLQAASASFTPTFQATIPDVLPEEEDYTRALSLSRLAYDLENLLSPAIAGLLLSLMGFHWLFAGTVAGFLLSAMLVMASAIPAAEKGKARGFRDRLVRGTWIYLSTPRLRGLLALNLAAASAAAFVLVNSVVLVRSTYGQDERALALAMACFGLGSMAVALALPRVLARTGDRLVMFAAAALLGGVHLVAGLVQARTGWFPWPALLVLWGLSGAFYTAVLTPSGRLLRRSAHAEDRPAVFTAQFALSHACWLLTYTLAGWGTDLLGLAGIMALLGGLSLAGTGLALILWPGATSQEIEHAHPDLPDDHPHLMGAQAHRHRHAVVIDDEHRAWPTQG
ncbi:MAG: MFS transporter [Rhodobacteraceae bacterium]|nr:MFS transporter [Paracoccaceae bacterium]